MLNDFHKNIFNIDNMIFFAANQHILMFSEGSWDTEHCSNGCSKFSFATGKINYLKKYIFYILNYFLMQSWWA